MSEFLHWAAVWLLVFSVGAFVGWGLTYAWHLGELKKEVEEMRNQIARIPG